ncbi:phage tail protein [Pandoraea pnomenusa]|uniref:Phage tail sheath protein n=2 Tax=Pandoraea pnomenusa TaxID=93220 RepID=A0A378YY43_9BURK|nr:tail protein [Pandoraea pnomenusa]AIU29353.1 phage tail protein [Pandoraea pnomenusa]SUA82004.1 Phage tail sheath protein [Pandoraea pnomenusa]
MPVFQEGALNTTALIVPDVYVQILSPRNTLINGLPTNILGIVGTAQWGPVNSPTIVGDMAGYAQNFGAVMARKYDMGTQVAVATLQGANNFRCVRVTDGTDVAASAALGTSPTNITFTAKYTGTLGNSLVVTLGTGSAANSWRAVVAMPGQVPEVFDNITGTGAELWANIAAAINSGQSGLRGPSQFIVATAGTGTTAPTAGTTTLTGGTDGATTITSATLLGVDTVPRKGMYALRNTFTSIAMLADCDESTSWTTQVAFGLSEGIYMIAVGPAGDSIANATATKASAGIDSYALKLLFGDWIYWQDTVNNVIRLVSPQGFVAGRLANLSPEQSSLNKPLYGIVGTQKSMQNQVYSATAEIGALAQAGIDVVTNPIPAGNSFGVRIGHNASSNPVVNGDNYTRMTNYLAYTLNSAMGKFVGKLQSTQKNDPLRRQAGSTISSWLETMKGDGDNVGMIDDFSNQCDDRNNPPNRVALGYMQDDCKVRYLGVVEKFIVNLEGGQSVTVTRQSTQPT